MANCALTTMDNPYNPFKKFKEWYNYDVTHGYNTCAWLDRYCKTSVMFEEDKMLGDIEDGMNAFLALNPFGIHMKVYENDADTFIPIANDVYKQVMKETK